jgi:hypothetical protein
MKPEELIPDAIGRRAALLVQQAYVTIARDVGIPSAERWYWLQHVSTCPDTQRHGCRASLGKVLRMAA